MKYQPYREIINIEIELKEYRILCRGKSKKYFYYLDWKAHIQELFFKFQSNDQIENFKHFLLNRQRISSAFSADYIPTIILYFTIIFSKMQNEYSIIICVLLLAFTVFFIMSGHYKYHEEFYFYCDLIKILEEIKKAMIADNFDYPEWRASQFDELKLAELNQKAADYDQAHSFTGNTEIL